MQASALLGAAAAAAFADDDDGYDCDMPAGQPASCS